MTGIAITLDIDGLADESLERVGLRALESGEFLDNIGAYLDSDVTRRFIAQEAPDGSKWKPSQAALDRGGRTLIDTGFLMGSVTHNVLNNDAVEHGLTAIYGAIHHFGGRTGRGGKGKHGTQGATEIAARPIIGIEARQQARIEKMTTRFMETWFQ